MSDPEALYERIVGYGVTALVAMVMIYVVYQFAATLVGDLPASIASAIILIAGGYIFTVKKEFREALLSWGERDDSHR